ncbi:MAG TPA: hypothetical protein VJ733_14715 [Candidatus Binatia bacterium]|nr:hypothetical protein [Candidatus Binatia bacterium]
MKTQLLKGLALGLFIAITCSPLHAQTADTTSQPAEPSASEEAGYGFGSVVANIFYMPAKITYAGLGLITGGLGYVLSAGRADVANNIIYPSISGNYVVTPSHLKGTEPLYFVGAPPPETGPRADVPSTATTATR